MTCKRLFATLWCQPNFPTFSGFQPSFHASHSGLNQVFQPSNRVQLWFPESHWPTPSFPTFSKGSTMVSRITLAYTKFSYLLKGFNYVFPNHTGLSQVFLPSTVSTMFSKHLSRLKQVFQPSHKFQLSTLLFKHYTCLNQFCQISLSFQPTCPTLQWPQPSFPTFS